ncbi:MAG: response regulator, partial [Saprospiraceae bacterium]
LQEASKMALELDYKLGIATSEDVYGKIFAAKNDYTNAMKRFVEALRIRNEVGDRKAIATSKSNIGSIFLLQEDYNSAEENLAKALEIFNELKDNGGAANAHYQLGSVYLAKEIYGKAKEHYRAAMELKLAAEEVEDAAAIANKIGNISRDLGDYEGAMTNYQMSLNLHGAVENLPKIAEDYTNMTRTYLAQRYYEEAEESNQIAYDIRSDLQDKAGLAETYKNFGLIYAGFKQPPKANENLAQSIALLKEIPLSAIVPKTYQEVAEAYRQLGSYDQAYRNQVIYSKKRAEWLNEEKGKALLDLTTKYESEFAAEQQQAQIEKLEIEQANAAQFRIVLLAIIGLIGLLLANVLFNYRRKKKDNELLTLKNTEIQHQKSEIEQKSMELEEKNASLDVLNQRLVHEMAERESIEQSSFARDRFLATMSHEMRTPMNIIIGLTHLLLEENPRPDQVEHLRTLQFSSNNLVVFINDILDFSKIEAGKLTLESREFKLQKMLADIKMRFEQPIQEKGNQVRFEYDNKLPETLVGDPIRLNQIMTNLVTTANNYTTGGNIEVGIKLHELHKDEATLLLTVKDNGTGIEPEKITEMFRKHDNQTGEDIFERYSSSDLALAITKRLVDLQNGQIIVTNNNGQGNSFTVHLPFKVAANKVKSLSKEQKKVSYSNLAGYRVLVAEDNKINQLVVAKMLRKLGMEVITADNGLEALDAFSQSNFDLILMDIQMPKMDGYRTTAEIRKMPDPQKRDIPIIALTASAFLTEKEKAKLFGMNDHVGKPFGPEDLLEKISACLSIYKPV